ncbi:hypothetical protein RIEPE_0196 [Candidatus Riesia pediculicola USDA]|uniref:Uncharacterized protein n=1 Tax=Riesia pediculicola (strain USDA) TaxID=515618 RepID=D4G804_RIEPU|nr:hypothetical protein RIEPE_0196 [Candidatus Riesia pediculicola USDA]
MIIYELLKNFYFMHYRKINTKNKMIRKNIENQAFFNILKNNINEV